MAGNVPKIRFPGFTEPWEQRKLGELATMNARIGWQNLRTSEFKDQGDYLLITGTDFKDGKIDYANAKYVEANRYDQDPKIQLHEDSILITKDGTLGKVAYVKDLPFPATLNAGVFNVRVKDNRKIFPEFLFNYVNGPFLMEYVAERSTGGTIKHLNQSVLIDLPIPIPSIREQRKISDFLCDLTSIITLHQRKLDDLKKFKSGLLQKMFPKAGETVPEVRFPEFTGDWEQRKLGELATMNARIGWQNLRTSEFKDQGDYLLITGTDFKDGKIDYANAKYVEANRYDQDPKIQLHEDSILITKDGTLGKVAYVKDLPFPATLNAGVFNVRVKDNRKIFPEFLFNYVNGPFLMEYVAERSTGGTIKHLNQSVLIDLPIPIPSIREQRKISDFLCDLTSIITLHQRKLDDLKKLKQGLLQQMFV